MEPRGTDLEGVLAQRFLGNRELADRACAYFVSRFDDLEEPVRRALATGDWSQIGRAVHKLAGTVAHFADDDLVAEGRSVELALTGSSRREPGCGRVQCEAYLEKAARLRSEIAALVRTKLGAPRATPSRGMAS